jgi:hypothetical protein
MNRDVLAVVTAKLDLMFVNSEAKLMAATDILGV